MQAKDTFFMNFKSAIKKHLIIQVILFLLLIALDQLSKVLLAGSLQAKGDVTLIPGVLDLHYLVELLNVLDEYLPAVALSEIAPVLRRRAASVAYVVVSADQDAEAVKILRERLVPEHVFRHSVGYLENGDGLARRLPYVIMDGALPVLA